MLAACFLLVSCFAYSSTMHIETVHTLIRSPRRQGSHAGPIFKPEVLRRSNYLLSIDMTRTAHKMTSPTFIRCHGNVFI
jgi:hypothetical protein